MTKRKFINATQLFAIDPVLLAVAILFFAMARGFSGWLTWNSLLIIEALALVCICPCILLLHANRSLWRYAEAGDYLRLIIAYAVGFILAYTIIKLFIPVKISILFLLSAVGFSLLASLSVRMLAGTLIHKRDIKRIHEHSSSADTRRDMIILGAGNAGVSLLSEMQRNPASPYRVRALLDDDFMKIGRHISGVTVQGQICKLPSY
jgi:FlaA1/EpsC-like NDP-sugar epimerase